MPTSKPNPAGSLFLISRIREEYDGGLDTREAVTRGLSRTARIITAAAAVMVTVFLSDLAIPDVAVKQYGLGLGIAVLLDATIVRMVLVPSLMELLGAANCCCRDPTAPATTSGEPPDAARLLDLTPMPV